MAEHKTPMNARDLQKIVTAHLRSGASKAVDVKVPQQPGLLLVLNKTKATWVLRYRLPGKTDEGKRQPQVEMKLGDYRTESFGLDRATLLAQEHMVNVQKGQNVRQEVKAEVQANIAAAMDAAYTVDWLARDYITDRENDWTATSRINMKSDLKIITRLIGAQSVSLVTKRHILSMMAHFHAEQKQKGKTGQRGARILTAATTIFNWAKLNGRLDGANPCEGVFARVGAGERDRILDKDEIGQWWANLTDKIDQVHGVSATMALAFKLALVTGARLGAIVMTKIEELDLDGTKGWAAPHDNGPTWKITPGDGKKMNRRRKANGTLGKMPPAQIVPLSSLAVSLWREAIAAKRHDANPWVFESLKGDHHMKRSSASCGYLRVKHYGWAPMDMVEHDLRRTARTWWGEAIDQHLQPPVVLEMMLGHATRESIQGKYDYSRAVRSQRVVADCWCETLMQLTSGAQSCRFHPPSAKWIAKRQTAIKKKAAKRDARRRAAREAKVALPLAA